ncbi:Ankyrin repeats (3 copies) [compost metagenome]
MWQALLSKLRTGGGQRCAAPPAPPVHGAAVDIEKRDAGGRTALMRAAHAGQLARVQELLAAGAQVDARDARNWSALMIAAHEGRSCVVLALAQANAGLAAAREGRAAAAQPMRRRSQALT